MNLDFSSVIAAIKKHPIGFGAGVLAIVLGVFSYFRLSSTGDLQTRLDDVAGQGAKLENNLRYSARLDEQLLAMETAIAEINRRAINPTQLATNLRYFYQLESELGLKLLDLQQVRIVETPQKTEYRYVAYSVAVEGRYDQLLKFIRRIESGERYIRITSSNLVSSPVSAEGDADPLNPPLTLSLTLHVLGRP